MKLRFLLFCALLGSVFSPASAETVIRILHIQSNPKIREISQQAAQKFESAHPGVKVQFDYLESEAFKAKLPTLLQSKERPSAFHSWGGGVMYEQVNSGICQDITKSVTEGGFKESFYPVTIQNFTVEGKANDLFASLDSWLVTKEAPKETIDFMGVWLGKDIQTELAGPGLFIPAAKGTAEVIQEPLLRQIAQEIDRSQWIQIAMDQLLGPDTGRVLNDMSADLASGNTTPEKAAKALEASWQQNKG